ncbi:hypothetical protein Cgig2_010832 [Carnegiea gigantea]|uniref:Reverse transcriptase zinc-binding domain-containing protein n=1 Tax=Carnegiea gigantea TaxID=171969 RepID=A0A9Q1JTC2_9CARY|nr:hypothetical protein Cgig2_010832 [Carnegiea gigantea]
MGSCWVIGNGSMLNIQLSRWLSRPVSFCPMTPVKPAWENAKVSDLIDFDVGGWRTNMVEEVFNPCDVNTIVQIPLSQCWPDDHLIWHYTPYSLFNVQSANHHIREMQNGVLKCSSSTGVNPIWRKIRRLNILPRIKLFGWKVCNLALATRKNLAKRIPGVVINCTIRWAVEEGDVHVFFLCPLAMEIWHGSGLTEFSAGSAWDSPRLCLEGIATMFDSDTLGLYVAILWEIWNAIAAA